ncbi:hypothetical protein KJ359_004232 [Pestalotiopsis sp. 9143b]|nr:hypothetical protein KJ359_004232 [Pestalotiopsis sp. 9143b]
MAKLRRWVAGYFVHYLRLAANKPDMTVNNELGRRFILEVVESKELEALQLSDLAKATQDDIKSLTGIFDAWLLRAVKDDLARPNLNPRFVDFLVVDEDSLRSLAALPEETIPLGPVTIQERRMSLYDDAYLWLVDSQAVRRYKGIDTAEDYNGLMRLQACEIPDAWFERAPRWEDACHIFNRVEAPKGSGQLWFRSS